MAASLALALGLFSCKDEPNKPAGKTTEPTEGITFQFTTPGGDAHVVDTRATTLHDNPEWAIDQLWMYVFDDKGENILEEPVNIRDTKDFKYTGNAAYYTYKKKWEKDTQLQFFFIANMKVALAKGDTKAKLMELVHEKEMKTASADILYDSNSSLFPNGDRINVTNDNYKRIPMTAYATQGNSRIISVYGNATVDVKLKRTIARIDIENRIPGFKITKLELINAFKKANVDEESTNVIADNRLTTPVSNFGKITSENSTGNRTEPTTIRKAFYLYEGKNVGEPDDQVTYVKVTAEMGGLKNRVYFIPFKTKDPATGKFTVAKDVKRNYLYKIVLGDIVVPGEATVLYTIEEEPWNGVEFEETLRLLYITNATLTDYTYAAATLNVEDNQEHVYSMHVTNDFVSHHSYTLTSDDNVMIPETSSYRDAGAADYRFVLNIKVSANTTGAPRTCHITIKSDACDEPFILTVNQPK